jgi:hypothetical protein
MNQSQRDLRTFMAIAQEQAIAEAENMPTTADIKQRAHALAEFARDRMAQMRRDERAQRPSNVVSGAIRAAIQAMSDAQVVVRMKELFALHPDMQLAHRDFEHLTAEDRRSALEDMESLAERGD